MSRQEMLEAIERAQGELDELNVHAAAQILEGLKDELEEELA